MRKRIVTMLTYGTVALLFSLAQSASAQVTEDVPAATTGIKVFSVDLTGGAAVPGPGAEGSGSAFVIVNPGAQSVCYAVDLAGISTPTAAHIHEGSVDEAGGPVVPLEMDNGGFGGCATNVDVEVVERIAEEPSAFYVNVHNEDFPQGALRGQLDG